MEEEAKYEWDGRKPVAGFKASEGSMSNERKEIIRKALDFDIIDIRSYTGYKGDMLVEITTMDANAMQAIKKIAEDLGLEVVAKKNRVEIYEIYCIAPTSDIYDLK